ncbi:MAG TPA: anti-sigma factor antagonist [Bacteroidetes bacterium]|nr:anti-sigma factor antagonist [Bacteroidota bacterium]
MEGIQVSVSKVGPQNNISLIKVGGYIDTTTSAELERALDELLRNGNYNIVIDLGNVDYISSAGWGIFISEIKGIREKGGDLKLVNMIPDVYEVFELLEFHYILKAFDSLDEAIKDFEMTQAGGVQGPVFDEEEAEEVESPEPGPSPATATRTSTGTQKRSLEEKIRQVILEKPDSSIFDIKKTLNTEQYDYTKIGIWDTWKLLKKLGLASKKKRMEFFRKQAFQS